MDGTLFDALARTLSTTSSRRGAIGSFAAAGLGLGLGWLGRDGAAAGKNPKKKDKGSGPKKDKKPRKPKKPDPPKPPGKRDICAKTWPGKGQAAQTNRDSCRATRKRCRRPGHGPFCILDDVIDAEGNSFKMADCCYEGETCCDGVCVDLTISEVNCGADCATRKACAPGEVCEGGTCRAPDVVCLDRNCLPGQRCHTTSVGYTCNGDPLGDCQCGCGPGLHYCQNPFLGRVCQSSPC